MTNHVHLIAIPNTPQSLALALGQAHSQYSLEQNRQHGRSGHLWQNRFFSCPLDTNHLIAALRYVELNPVRAAITGKAWEWPWSSARAHVSVVADDMLLDWPWTNWMEQARMGVWNHREWSELLCTETPDNEFERVRRATRVGEPLGSRKFVSELEAAAGRRLHVRHRGRPSTKKFEAARQRQ